MKTLLRAAAVLVGLLVVAVLGLMAVGTARLAGTLDVPPHDVPAVASTPESLAEGARLADVFACTECHGAGLEGTDFLDGGPFMRMPAPNLTGQAFTNVELERAIRHGVGADGRVLIVMPSEAFASMSDDDLSDLVGYIHSLPRQDVELMARSVGPIGRAVAAFQAPDLQPSRVIEQTEEHASLSGEPGAYYAPMCGACHGEDLGGKMFAGETPIWAPNLTDHVTGIAGWSEEAFDAALRRGVGIDGRELDPAAMPWRGFAGLEDREVAAIWSYVKGLPPVERSAPAS